MEEMQKLLSALCYEEPVFQLFYFLAINTGMRRGELCALRWSDVIVTGSYEGYIIVQHSRSTVSGEGVQEGKTKNGRARTVSMSEDLFSLLTKKVFRSRSIFSQKTMARSFIRTPSASTSKRYSRNWDSRKATICTPSDTFLFQRFCMRAWTKIRSQTSPVTAIRPSWSAPTATHRCSASRTPPSAWRSA